jgi:hypothetical protein
MNNNKLENALIRAGAKIKNSGVKRAAIREGRAVIIWEYNCGYAQNVIGPHVSSTHKTIKSAVMAYKKAPFLSICRVV